MAATIKPKLRPVLQLIVSEIEAHSELNGISFRLSGNFPNQGGKPGAEFLLRLAGATTNTNLDFRLDVVARTRQPELTVFKTAGGRVMRTLSLSFDDALRLACSPAGPSGETPVLDALLATVTTVTYAAGKPVS